VRTKGEDKKRKKENTPYVRSNNMNHLHCAWQYKMKVEMSEGQEQGSTSRPGTGIINDFLGCPCDFRKPGKNNN
jgi:hypothetical protein